MKVKVIATRGDSFGFIGRIPESFADGYFVGWTLQCQVRNVSDGLVADLLAQWVDPLTTRLFEVTDTAGTSLWPVGQLFFDLRMTAPDGSTKRTPVMLIQCERGVTRV